MKTPIVDLKIQYQRIDKKLKQALKLALGSFDFILGKETEKFEKAFASYIGRRYCVGVNSGTDALVIGLHGLNLKPGDEVIVPANTFNATAEAVTLNGLRPVFVDINENFGINIDDLRKKITKKTRAIIVVHLFGQADDISAIRSVIKKIKQKILLVEDCSQAHGALYKGKRVGTFGVFSAFSLYPTKNLGAYGDAGALLTNDARLARRAKMLRNHGQVEKDVHLEIGYNSRLDSLQAAILRTKLKYLNQGNRQRQTAAKLYSKLLKSNSFIITPQLFPNRKSVYHLYVIRARKRDQLKKYLAKKGIQTAIHFPQALHLQKAFQNLKYRRGDFPGAERAAKEILSLPMFPGITTKQISHVVSTINAFYEKN